MATCPECDVEIELDDSDLEELEVGDPWDCDACGSRLRVAGLDPVDFETDEDEDDEEDEEDGDSDDEDGDDADDDDEDLDDDDDSGSGDGGWDE
jgi:lysine biosynthesis protein LysW